MQDTRENFTYIRRIIKYVSLQGNVRRYTHTTFLHDKPESFTDTDPLYRMRMKCYDSISNRHWKNWCPVTHTSGVYIPYIKKAANNEIEFVGIQI